MMAEAGALRYSPMFQKKAVTLHKTELMLLLEAVAKAENTVLDIVCRSPHRLFLPEDIDYDPYHPQNVYEWEWVTDYIRNHMILKM